MTWVALTIAVAVAAGALARRRYGERALAFSRRLLTAMLFVLSPPVVFFNIARLELDADVGIGIACAWAAVVLTGVVAYLVARRVLALDRPRTGTLVNASLHPNTGYLGLPLCAAVLGTDHLSQAVAFDVLVGTTTLLFGVFSVGAAFGTEAGQTRGKRVWAFVSRNPPLLAAVAGLLVPDSLAPGVLVDASRVLVFALLPLGFLAVGITLAFPPPRPTRAVAAAVGLRLVVAPALLLAIAAPLIDLPDAYLLLAAMPSGLNGLTVAHAYGLDVDFAAGAIAWSTAVVLVAGLAATALT